MELPVQEFIRRIIEHIPERGIHTVRSYGLFANSNRRKLNYVRGLLGQLPVEEAEEESWQDVCEQAGELHPERCPVCQERLVCVAVFASGSDPPVQYRKVA